MSNDPVYDEVMAMSEEEIRAELAAEGKTMEGVAAEMRVIFERAKAEVNMRKAIQAWLKCPAAKRPSAFSLGYQVEKAAMDFTREELRVFALSNGQRGTQ